MRFKAGTDEWVLGAGGFVYLPRGVIHQPMVEGEHPATVLAVLSRPGLEDFFAEFSSELAKSGGRRPWSCWTALACHMACGISRHDQARPRGGSFYRHQDVSPQRADPGPRIFFGGNLLIRAQTLGTILTRASCTFFSRSASCRESWYGMVRMR